MVRKAPTSTRLTPGLLARRYTATLRKYLRHEEEAGLEQAYELGRLAMAHGLGALDVARIHQDALYALFCTASAGDRRRTPWSAAKSFFLESLSPYEATHRGFGETNIKLQQAVDALERRNTELGKINGVLKDEIDERQRVEQALQNLSRHIIHLQEEERKRISRELHDEVGQSLTAIIMAVAALRNDHAAKQEDLTPNITRIQRLLEETTETVHRFARELRPAMLDELGLLPALRSHVKNFSERTGLRVMLGMDSVAEKLNDEQKTAIFRITQESLTNVAKHARASRVKISIRQTGNGVYMEVADNGKSFRTDPENSARRKQRLGLLGMQERVRLINGVFDIKAVPDRGTTVCVMIPFMSTQIDRRILQPRI